MHRQGRLMNRFLLALTLLLAGCIESHPPPRIFVAASLVNLAESWQRGSLDSVQFHFGASMTLAHQIVAGARADFFLPAGDFLLQNVELQKQVRRIDSAFLRNRLVLICRPDIKTPAELADVRAAQFRQIALADPMLAPAGRYAKEGLQSAGLWEELNQKWILLGDVRSVLAAVASGAVDAGFVYATDARALPHLQFLDLRDDTHFPVVWYPLVMLGGETPEKNSIWDYLHSSESRSTAKQLGFE